MVLDLLPVVGIPLPFMSYGITNLWVGFASIGCINSITAQRLTNEI
jgi:cell division protein FtsW (lipid II flippase)